MLLFLCATGIVLSIILLYFNTKKFNSSVYLGSFFFLVSLYGLIQYVLFYSRSEFLISIFYINFTFLTYLIGPTLFWYIRSVLNDDAKLGKKDLWHLAPSLIFLVASLPYIFTSWSDKMNAAAEITGNVAYLAQHMPTFLHQLFPGITVHISRLALALVYLIWSMMLFFRYLSRNKETAVFADQRYMIKWISLLLGFVLILVSSQLFILAEAYAFRNSKLFFTFNLLQIISASGLTGLLITPFFFPGILYGLPRYPEIILQHVKSTPEVYLAHEAERRKEPRFESDYIELIIKKLDHCMMEQQLYLLEDCNLVNVSKCINLPVHHLAYYFREVKKQSFNDFRNGLRIEHAKRLIREGRARELSLEGIAMQSGFSTRNTFFTAFKKIEGETPSAYSSKYST